MAIAVGVGSLAVSYTETLDPGGSDRLATITVTASRLAAAASTATIQFTPPSQMTPAELDEWQAFVDAVDEQVTHLLAALDAVAVQPAV